jgi:hypothetical protein
MLHDGDFGHLFFDEPVEFDVPLEVGANIGYDASGLC